MSNTEHRKALIMNRLRDTLEQLQREGVGFINQETCDGIDYVIDGVSFCVVIDGGGPV